MGFNSAIWGLDSFGPGSMKIDKVYGVGDVIIQSNFGFSFYGFHIPVSYNITVRHCVVDVFEQRRTDADPGSVDRR